MFEYVVSPQYMKLFLSLNERSLSISDEAHHIDMTYSHLSKAIRSLEEEGFIQSKMVGRKKMLGLTAAGQSVADGLALVQHGMYLASNKKG